MDIHSVREIFIRYILGPLIMVLFVMVLTAIRKNVPKIKLKHIILYIICGAFIIGLPGFLGFSGNLFNPYWYLIAMIFYLGVGILHVNLTHYYFRKHFESLTKSIIFELILTLACALAGGAIFIILFRWIGHGLGNPITSATSIISFIIPLLFYYTYIQYISIPFDIYKTWEFDLNRKAYEFRGVDFEKLMVLNVEISKQVGDQRFNIKAKTIPTIEFGDWFHRVLTDYNLKHTESPIQILDADGKSFFWIFYVKRSFFSLRKYIDFDRQVSLNGLTENETVICKRVINNTEE